MQVSKSGPYRYGLTLMAVHADRAFMERAIALARRSKSEPGRVSPKVGTVLARDGVVIGEAFRGELAPGDHAEFTLLETKLADETLAGATLYTTLEPCTVRNEPKLPCAERIIERRIGRVVIGVLDPNDDIRGRGELRLREAGIEVARFDSDLWSQIEELNRDFARLHAGAKLRRTKAQTSDPPDSDQVRPNGHRVGYTGMATKSSGFPIRTVLASIGRRCFGETMRTSCVPTTSCGTRCGGTGIKTGGIGSRAAKSR
jgi:pyrimidine deaminase RibD-like protein